jgi:hypothetical protein
VLGLASHRMAARRFRLAALLLAGVRLLSTSTAFAQAKAPPEKTTKDASPPAASTTKPVDGATKAEAASRFERGLKLFNAGDNSGALAEFKRIYDILPNPVVLYNIGLVYAAMARPVDAVDALEPAIRSGALSPKDLERAQQTLADQKARVARLTVTTVPEGARVEVDGVQVAKTPLTAPVRIAEGSHIVGAVAEGYAPARREIVVAGNADANVHLELVALQGKQLANLSVRSLTQGADVLVDGKREGRTPLTTSITLPAGRHVVELKRPGYVGGRREIDLGAGATGDVALDLAVDGAALDAEGATLVIESSESPVDLGVDGQRKGPYGAPVRLPRGPHRVSVTAAGFIPAERDVNLDPSVTNMVRFVLEPTPETRENHRSTALFHRTWGWVGVIGGAVIGGTGVAFVAIGSSQKSEGENGVAEVDRKLAADEPPCDQLSGFASTDGTSFACDQARSDAQAKVDAGKTKSIAGYVGIGVGGALAVTGVVLLLTGDDPDKYEHPRARKAGPRFALVPGPGELGTALRATF